MQINRIQSLDIFRGLTIFLMVFVNDLAGVSNIPAWMKHVPPNELGMTFVDVVFPAFLFIVGMAIPFAVKARMERDPNEWQFWKHVGVRTLGLLVLGVYMVNSEEWDAAVSIIPKYMWAPALYIAAVLIWNRYPKTDEASKKRLYGGLKIFGVAILIGLYLTYRKTANGEVIGMTTSWWGILGLIGWAYLLAVLIYRLAQKRLSLVGIGYILLSALFVAIWAKILPENGWTNWLSSQGGDMSHTLIALSGTICSIWLLQDRSSATLWKMLGFGGALFALGYLVTPFGGISKVLATPAWTYYCAAICCWLFPLIYWIVDMKGYGGWANFVHPAGQNPLLTYIIPPFIYGILGFSFLPEFLYSGVPGFFKAVLFSLLILWVAKWLTKWGVKLHL